MSNQNERIAAFLQKNLDIDSTPQERERREGLLKDFLPTNTDHLAKLYDRNLVTRLWKFVEPYNRRFMLAVVLIVFSSMASVGAPYIIKRAVDDGVSLGDYRTLRFWAVVFIAITLVEFVTNRWRMLIMAVIGTRVIADIRSAMFRHLHTLSLTFHNQYSVGRLMSRLISDVGVLQEFITWSITGVARAVFMLFGIVIVMLAVNWQLALVAFAMLPLMGLIANYWRKHARAAYIRTRSILSHINGYLNESISGVRVAKSFTREKRNVAHFDDLNQSHFESLMVANFLSAIFFPAIEFFSYLTTALIVGVGGYLVIGDALTAGTLIAFVLWVGRFFDPIRELARRLNTFQATMAASERIFNLLDMEADITDVPNAHQLQNIEGRVVFDDVWFSYKEEEHVLEGVSVSAEPGERIALVGETGAGKSTIIRLLSRFFEITDGAITIDGYDIRQVTKASLRQQLGIVLQDTFLFSGTLMDNIRYGRLEASDEEVIDAAKAVGAHSFISRLPDGYNTDVGENGVNLSVGQRQIVSFARALLADPAILILDEATSSVDTTTEKLIEKAVDRLMAGRTSFVIAHRLSTIVSADKIVVLDKGHIVEMGSHAELIEKRGRYYNLYTMQWAGDAAESPIGSIAFSKN